MADEVQTEGIVQNRRTRVVNLILAAFAVLVGVMVVFYLMGVRYNGSPSYPKGFYILTKIEGGPKLGRLVFVCPPNTEIFQEARRRAYIGHGMCAGTFTPIIKRVTAREGSLVQIVQGSIVVDGVRQPNSTIYSKDSEGRPLPAYGGGVLRSDEYLLLSDYFAGSFDSRYFGPLKREYIIGYANPVF